MSVDPVGSTAPDAPAGGLGASGPEGGVPAGRSRWGRIAGVDVYGLWPIAVMVVIIIVTSTRSDRYLTVFNLENVVSQIAPLGIATMGQTVLLISGGIDLSVGYNAAFASVVTGLMLEHGHPLGLAVLLGVLAATAVGFVNGVLAAQNRAHPFIITLGMSIFLFGLDTQLTGGAPVNDMKGLYTTFGGSFWGGVPTVAVPLVVAILAAYVFLRWSRLGRQAYAIGGNEEATYLAGIRVKRTKIYLYTLMGLVVGVTGMVLAGQINEASFNLAQNYELESIACAVIGGVALFGGRGGAIRALMGVALYGVVQNAISFLGLSSNYQQMALGAIIVVAVMVARASR